jgi:hypothetical protein
MLLGFGKFFEKEVPSIDKESRSGQIYFSVGEN